MCVASLPGCHAQHAPHNFVPTGPEVNPVDVVIRFGDPFRQGLHHFFSPRRPQTPAAETRGTSTRTAQPAAPAPRSETPHSSSVVASSGPFTHASAASGCSSKDAAKPCCVEQASRAAHLANHRCAALRRKSRGTLCALHFASGWCGSNGRAPRGRQRRACTGRSRRALDTGRVFTLITTAPQS